MSELVSFVFSGQKIAFQTSRMAGMMSGPRTAVWPCFLAGDFPIKPLLWGGAQGNEMCVAYRRYRRWVIFEVVQEELGFQQVISNSLENNMCNVWKIHMSQPLKLHLVKLKGILTRHEYGSGVGGFLQECISNTERCTSQWKLGADDKTMVLSNFRRPFPPVGHPKWWQKVREAYYPKWETFRGDGRKTEEWWP